MLNKEEATKLVELSFSPSFKFFLHRLEVECEKPAARLIGHDPEASSFKGAFYEARALSNSVPRILRAIFEEAEARALAKDLS